VNSATSVPRLRPHWAGCVLAAWLIGWCFGCHSAHQSPLPSKSHVVIGALRGTYLTEEQAIRSALRDAGIEMYLDGSVVYDILVPENQAEQAIEILSTNRLILEDKLVLSMPSGKP
jgi:hypothetical protein